MPGLRAKGSLSGTDYERTGAKNIEWRRLFIAPKQNREVNRMSYRSAQAGSLESGDVLVRLTPTGQDALDIRVESKVSPRFSRAIRQTVQDVAAELGVLGLRCEIVDRGALDFVLRARVTTAFRRAMEVSENG